MKEWRTRRKKRKWRRNILSGRQRRTNKRSRACASDERIRATHEADEVDEHEKRTARDNFNAAAGVRDEAPPKVGWRARGLVIALLVEQPGPKSCHIAPQPTLEEASADQTSVLGSCIFFVAADRASTRADANSAYRTADVVHGASAAQRRVR